MVATRMRHFAPRTSRLSSRSKVEEIRIDYDTGPPPQPILLQTHPTRYSTRACDVPKMFSAEGHGVLSVGMGAHRGGALCERAWR